MTRTESARLLELQRRIEDGAVIRGIERARENSANAKNAGREAFTPEGAAFVQQVIEKVLPLYVAEIGTRKRSRLEVVKHLPARRVCVVACQAALQRMSQGEEKLARVSERVGRTLELLARRSPKPKARKRKGKDPRREVVRRRWADWSQDRRIKIGQRFVDYLLSASIFDEVRIPASRRNGKLLKPARGVALSAGAMRDVQELAAFLAAARPVNPPCVAKPVPWSDIQGGGYHFRLLPLVRRAGSEQTRRLRKASDSGKLKLIYGALNALQSVPWRINKRLFEVALAVINKGVTPAHVWRPVKRSPALSAPRGHAARSKNKAMRSRVTGQGLAMAVAAANKEHPRIYFPHNIDFRGRVYPAVDFLSPQGNDLQRGLLEFANGDPLDGRGVWWLKVHLANTYGEDKVSFAKRVEWAEKHEEDILACAEDPLGSTFWRASEIKTPWQFLAACFAWRDYRKDGAGSRCHIPVMLDGSCSAFQHYAAALRDDQVAPLVNLIKGDAPGDLYEAVTRSVRKMVKASPKKDALSLWKGRVDRATVKRAVMVEPYGASHLSKLKYIKEQLEEGSYGEEIGEELAAIIGEDEDDEFAALNVLTAAVGRATKAVAQRPLEGMKWLRALARAWSKQAPKVPLGWTAPSGLPVVSPYYRMESAGDVTGQFNGTLIYISTIRPTSIVNWRSTETAIAPNFIHSLDASHLIFSVSRAARARVSQLCTVHDAFGTTPSKTDRLVAILREEFARLYETDHLARLADEATEAGVLFDMDLKRGALPVEAIREASYLFA